MLQINNRISIPLTEFNFKFSRSPGPGGQNVNKVNTKVTLSWNVESSSSIDESVKLKISKRFPRRINKQGDFLVTSHRFRDQGRNVADCLAKLRELLQEAMHSSKPRKLTKPTKASVRKRIETKKRQSEKKNRRKTIQF